MQAECAVLVDNRVPGVVAALKANHHVGVLGQVVDDPPLPFIAPLSADDGGYGHANLPNGYTRMRRVYHLGRGPANRAN